MAACGSLQHIFDKPLPENPTLIESLSWNQIKPVKPSIEQSSFTEIFGELHFKENPQSPFSSSFPIQQLSSSPLTGSNSQYDSKVQSKNDGLNHRKIDSLQLCTEGLGFESSYDVEDSKNEMNNNWEDHKKRISIFRRSRTTSSSTQGRFPPPISSISLSGKPCVCFKSYREDGRFILKEIRIPTQEFLHAHREDGRLKMHFVHPTDEIIEQDEEELEGNRGEHEESVNSIEEADHDFDGNNLKQVKIKLDQEVGNLHDQVVHQAD